MNRSSPLPDNAAAALCYLAMPLSAVVLLLLDPFRARPFVRFHAWQAIATCAALIGASIATRICAAMLLVLPVLGRVIAGLMMMTLTLGGLALWIWLMLQALQGNRARLPILGDWAASR